MLQDQPASGVTTPTPMLVAEDDGLRIPIDQPVLLIGRSKRRTHHQINDPHVSSVHCEIHVKDGELRVRDCSRHGTRINGRKVDESELLDGDILQIFKYRFRVERSVIGRESDQSRNSADPSPERLSSDSRQAESKHPGSVVRDGWFVRMAGVELGPMPWSDIVDMAQGHEVTRTDEVREEFESEWKTAGNMRGLFPDSKLPTATDAPSMTTESATEESTPEAALENITAEADFDAAADSSNPDAVAAHAVPETTLAAVDGPKTSAVASEAVDGTPAHGPVPATEGESAEEVIDLVVETDLSDVGLGDDEIHDRPVATSRKAGPAPRRRPMLDYEPDPKNPRYFMRRKGRELGPLDFEKLQKLAAEGRLSELDSIRTDVNPDWVSAATVKDLFIEGDSRDLSDEGYAASLLAEMDSMDNSAASREQNSSIPESEIDGPSSQHIPGSFGDPGYTGPGISSLPPLPVPAARDDSKRMITGDVLAPLFYLQSVLRTWPVMGVACVLVAMMLFSLIPSFQGSVVLGQVTLDGQPLKDASITFTDTRAGIAATGLINEDGTYVVTTMEGGMAPGKYLVTFAPTKMESDAVIEELQRQFLAEEGVSGALEQYQNLDSGDPTSADSDWKPVGPLPQGTIPMKYRAPDSSKLEVDVIDGRNEFPFELKSK